MSETKEASKKAGKAVEEKAQASAAEIRKKQLNEKIPYVARRPIGVPYDVEDVTVTINGYNYRVKYDEQVLIPRFVAEVLDSAYNEGKKTNEMIKEELQRTNPIAEM